MGRVEGKVAFVTGAARGQGRSHAIRLAEEGADIIAIDVPGDYDSVGYPMGTEAELADTVKHVEEHDLELGRELAAAGRGRLLRVRHHRDVAPALSRAFAA